MKRLVACALASIFVLVAMPAFSLDVEKDIVEKARQYVGCEYQTGGTKPSRFDCSGFVGYIVRPYAPALPRLSKDMSEFGTPIDRKDLLPGDLVFFATTENVGIVSHVALYIGDDTIIHAISDGPNRGVTITPLSARYWATRYHNAIRVLPLAKPATATKPGATPKPGAAAKPDIAAKPKEPSPWDTWDGYIAGDYDQWKAEQDRKYEEFRKAEASNGEGDAYEAWKKANEKK